MKKEFSRLLLAWYAKNARSLPWRGHPDPYAVWVSEIMLQQTRVDTVIPYFQRWLAAFPSVAVLASASEHQVLSAWEGLGYYSRARNLFKAAQKVVEKFDGHIPSTAAELASLPGIGRYTAAAISSIAFGSNEAVVDGNVKRVLARVFLVQAAINSPEGEKTLWTLAEDLLPFGHAGDYNQAVMDLGATICTPKNPACPNCPLTIICQAYQHGFQTKLPVKLEKKVIPHLTVCAAVIRCEDRVLIARRPSRGLLGGMWEFPGGKVEKGEMLQSALLREIDEELRIKIEIGGLIGEYHHAYTHFRVTLHAWECALESGEPYPVEASEIRWVKLDELSDYPMGKIDRSISHDLVHLQHSH